MIKVLIADDQALIRESLQIVLSAHQDIEVVGTVGDGLEVLDFLKSNRPHVILMDIRMPNLDGVLCTKQVKELYPDIKIIILTTFDDDDFIFSALKQVEEKNVADLSKVEWTIIQQVGVGLSNREIATKLFLSEGTVRNYLSTILSKLSLRDRTQLAIWAVQTGVTTRDFGDKHD